MVLTKQELIAALQDEARILQHLCGKVKPEMVDYRPTAKQRSTLELLRYLTAMGPMLVPAVKTGAFSGEAWGARVARADAMDFDAVVADLATQSAFYAESIGAFSDEELRGEIEMFGSKASRGSLLVKFILSGHAAYRTQLFCYLKSAGRDELNTMNLWAGIDGEM